MYIYHTYKSKSWLIDTVTIYGRKEYYSSYSKAVERLTIPFYPSSDDAVRTNPYANPKG